MFEKLTKKICRDKDYPERTHRLESFEKVLDGSIYDSLHYEFEQDQEDKMGEYISISERKPNVRYNLCKMVVDDSVSLLFSNEHMPEIICDEDNNLRDIIELFVKKTNLNSIMIEAATKGSVGSVAIWYRIIKNKPLLKVINTKYLTPIFDISDNTTLIKVIEQFKVDGSQLKELGYDTEENVVYWWKREWTETEEIYYYPKKVYSEEKFVINKEKTINHGLGFCPFIWIKNLPTVKEDEIDGLCTFENAIETQISIEYLLSQAGRGLKYSAEPTLLLKSPEDPFGPTIKGGGNAIVVGQDGDAKMLEISGDSTSAVIEHCSKLREWAIESIHGNRVSPEKMALAQSGKAMELMNQSLVWLADRLRVSYGDGAILKLIEMFLKSSKIYEINLGSKKVKDLNEDTEIYLKWPAWYPVTSNDINLQAQALLNLKNCGYISTESAVKSISTMLDIEDPIDEIERIDYDNKKALEEQKQLLETQNKFNPPNTLNSDK